MEVSVEHAAVATQDQSNEMEFYVVSLKKCLILFFATFGCYAIYWFFKHWSQYKKSTNEEMWPIMRGLFGIFYIHALFALFEVKYANKTGQPPKSISYLATIYVLVSIGSFICSKLSDNDIGNPSTAFLSFLALPVSAWVLYQAQSLANYAGADVAAESNSKLTALNYLWLVIGVGFWLLFLLGLSGIADGM